MSAASWLSIVLAAAGITGLWLSGSRRKVGWLIGFLVQPVWLVYAVVTEAWGFVATAVAYGWVYARNYLAWRREEHGMAITKRGEGSILPDPEQKKTAAPKWTAKDEAELAEELAEDDPEA